jgi:hypothetical protein
MLPGLSGGTGEFMISSEIGIGERTADLREDVGWGDGACPGIGILQEQRQGLAGVRMRDGPVQRSPEQFNAIGFRIVV